MRRASEHVEKIFLMNICGALRTVSDDLKINKSTPTLLYKRRVSSSPFFKKGD
jgi:hypothetical protein